MNTARRRPVTYVRKSVVQRDDAGNVRYGLSPEVQEAEVRRLGERYGDPEPLILTIRQVRGRSRTEQRFDYQRLLAMVEQGEVSAIYAYSMSRLSRSVKDYAALAELCVEHSVPVRLYKEGEQDFTSATGRLISGVMAHIAQFVADIASEQVSEAIRAKVANGGHHGAPLYGAKPGEDVAAVEQAYRDAGSLSGAAHLLDERGIPSRRGGPWRRGSIRRFSGLSHRASYRWARAAESKARRRFRWRASSAVTADEC